ncbi:MAG: 50S ribosomal protein L25 [Candidatus Woesebacteria bacterium GW2011_GWB1_38_5b]|uniref:Large ribosomal subunit protein bL25 n=1 Tax=Candidatus Woesebacteria bacterium GW2011_GWB1_38_5b TaxID=1618569 RepID=A0A0G0K7X3_9BACT|nr:MAG: 50S ribosomal protein L25 [Candidatus Woesebacteria bacterium GW2011_GWB1_38_5b]
MAKINLQAENRKIIGRGVKNLRKKGRLPANVFGKKIDSIAVDVGKSEFLKVYGEAGETGLVDLNISGSVHPVLVSELQLDPVTDEVLQVDFHEVDLKEQVSATVPVELIGESPAQKSGIGTVVQQIDEIEVTALPMDLPDKFEIDISELIEVDQAIYVKDLKYDKDKVKLETDLEDIVVKVEPPQKEEVIAVAPAATEVEVTQQAKPEEGDAPVQAQEPGKPLEG